MKQFVDLLYWLCLGIFVGLELGAYILGIDPEVRSYFNIAKVSVIFIIILLFFVRLLSRRE